MFKTVMLLLDLLEFRTELFISWNLVGVGRIWLLHRAGKQSELRLFFKSDVSERGVNYHHVTL